jgi:hypothetical protein
LRGFEPFHVKRNIFGDRGREKIAWRLRFRGFDRGFDRPDETRQMSPALGIVLDHFDRGADRAAIRVSEHHDERHAEKFHRIFEAGEPIVIGEIAGEPDNKKIAGSLIERKFRGNALKRIIRILMAANPRSSGPR